MRKPWNAINSTVYSLLTYAEDGSMNMNICTYVCPVSMKPKQYIVALEYGSKSWQNLKSSEEAILQILSVKQCSLIRKLGKKSGNDVNKEQLLRKTTALCTWDTHEVLADSFALMALKKIHAMPAADHEVFLCEVMRYKVLNPREAILGTDLLKELNIIL